MNLWTLQTEVTDWSHRNFGDGHPAHPLLGLIEELGELVAVVHPPEEITAEATVCVRDLLEVQNLVGALAHAVLKSLQGIRGGDLQRVQSLSLVVAGAAGFLTDLLGRNGVDRFCAGTNPENLRVSRVDAVGDLEIYLADFCRRNGINLGDAVAETWQKVKNRNWKAHPETGGQAEL